MTLRDRLTILSESVRESEHAAHALWLAWTPTLAERTAWNRVVAAQGALSDALTFLDTAALRLPADDQNAPPVVE